MKTASVADVTARFSAFLDESQKEPVIIVCNRKPIAMLVGVQDQDELERLVFASSRRLQQILEKGRKEIRNGRGIPNEEFWKQVDAEQPTKKGKRGRKESADRENV
jgi:antitoxin (DNA-binding transcriptional repressor) of toxin-antitoxin stability system